MVATAAHLTDHVLPPLPVRQWVLAVPKRRRYVLQRDADLQGAALRLFLRVVEQQLRAHVAVQRACAVSSSSPPTFHVATPTGWPSTLAANPAADMMPAASARNARRSRIIGGDGAAVEGVGEAGRAGGTPASYKTSSGRSRMDRTQRCTLVATGLGLFMIFLDALIVNVALPDIQRAFAVGEQGLQWVVAAYSLGMAVFIMSAATLADLQGRRRWYVAGIVVFTLASVACGLAPTLELLNVARGVQGVAAATANVTSLALVSAAFPDPGQKARAIGIWTAIASVGTAIGPTLGGFLVEQLGWRSIFLVNVPVGIVVVWLTLRFGAESRDERPRTFDVGGQLLFAVTVGAFAYAVIEGPKSGWTSAPIVALFATALGGLALFVWYERRSADPMMDVTLFGDRAYAMAILTICMVLFAVYGMLLLTTQYLQNVRGHSPQVTGFMILPFSASMTIVSPLVGRFVGRFGARLPILCGLMLMIAGFALLIVGVQGIPVVLLAGLALCGTGGALCLTPITTLAMTSVPRDRAGMASGIMSAQRAIGATVGFAVMGSILAAWLSATLEPHLAQALPDPAERRTVAAAIVASANPRAHVAEIAPRQPVVHADPATRAAIVAIAEADFVEGIRVAFGVAIALLALVLLAASQGFPRGTGVLLTDAEREAAKLAANGG